MLEVKDLKVAYGRVRAVKGISFTVEQGQVVTLVGTNGAGKTTTLRTISGLLRPESGEIDATVEIGGASWVMWHHSRAASSSPVNGGSPASAS